MLGFLPCLFSPSHVLNKYSCPCSIYSFMPIISKKSAIAGVARMRFKITFDCFKDSSLWFLIILLLEWLPILVRELCLLFSFNYFSEKRYSYIFLGHLCKGNDNILQLLVFDVISHSLKYWAIPCIVKYSV